MGRALLLLVVVGSGTHPHSQVCRSVLCHCFLVLCTSVLCLRALLTRVSQDSSYSVLPFAHASVRLGGRMVLGRLGGGGSWQEFLGVLRCEAKVFGITMKTDAMLDAPAEEHEIMRRHLQELLMKVRRITYDSNSSPHCFSHARHEFIRACGCVRSARQQSTNDRVTPAPDKSTSQREPCGASAKKDHAGETWPGERASMSVPAPSAGAPPGEEPKEIREMARDVCYSCIREV